MAIASSIVSTSNIRYPPMASLDSAKGPSITTRPFLPETVTPVRSSARPGLALPCAVNLSNQALFWLMSFWSSSCESVLYHSLLRYNSMYPLRSCVFISIFIGNLISLIFIGSKLRRTSNPVWDKLYFSGCRRVALPKSKGVALGILADGEITHLRHGRFSHADFSTEFRNFISELVDRIHTDVVDDWLLRMFTPLQRAVRTIVCAAGIDVPVIAITGKWIDFPAKQIAVKRLGAFWIVGWDFKPSDACILFLL